MGLLPKGAVFPAIARTIDNAWVRIVLPDGREAWVFRESMESDLDAIATLPVIYTPAPTDAPATEDVPDSVDVPDAVDAPATPAVAPNEPVAEATPVTDAPPTASLPADDTPASVQTHVVQPGEFLKQLAVRYYGDEELWTLIYEANVASIGPDPDLLPAGIELVIPSAP